MYSIDEPLAVLIYHEAHVGLKQIEFLVVPPPSGCYCQLWTAAEDAASTQRLTLPRYALLLYLPSTVNVAL